MRKKSSAEMFDNVGIQVGPEWFNYKCSGRMMLEIFELEALLTNRGAMYTIDWAQSGSGFSSDRAKNQSQMLAK